MARGSRTITIRIVNDAASSEPSVNAERKTEDAEGKKKETKAKSAKVAAAYATAQIIGTVKSMAETGYGRYLSLTEDYISQNAQRNLKNHLARFSNVAISGGIGIKLGAAFGPLGAIIGGVLGASMGAIRNEFSRINTLAEQTRAIHEEAYSLYFNTERAGMINYSRGTEN